MSSATAPWPWCNERFAYAVPHRLTGRACERLLELRRHPLPRITDAILERANRTSACPAFRKRAQGQSCDEYPFARTNQGASKSDRHDWGWAWVPISEENSQARCLSAFYQAQRVLNGDKFWVEVP
ncbi:NucA/NucB deoxyribonuclease domain-containing protein [Streptomyces sp. NPDC059835]|uniref:NucA/NucB deoxyribonuclease domain-containing protein n=1 Tax=Streptomyces sp. NPDC059835 TaxID=3346967 RepID=UPI00365265A4